MKCFMPYIQKPPPRPFCTFSRLTPLRHPIFPHSSSTLSSTFFNLLRHRPVSSLCSNPRIQLRQRLVFWVCSNLPIQLRHQCFFFFLLNSLLRFKIQRFQSRILNIAKTHLLPVPGFTLASQPTFQISASSALFILDAPPSPLLTPIRLPHSLGPFPLPSDETLSTEALQ